MPQECIQISNVFIREYSRMAIHMTCYCLGHEIMLTRVRATPEVLFLMCGFVEGLKGRCMERCRIYECLTFAS